MGHQQVKFYQTGTLTVGNRLLDEETRTVHTKDRSNSLIPVTGLAKAAVKLSALALPLMRQCGQPTTS